MGSGFSKMKKQARLMQEQYTQMQEEMRNSRVIGTIGNDLITVTLDGNGKLCDIVIKPECVDPQDVEGLQDLILAAYEKASKKLDEGGQKDLSSMMANPPFSF